MWSEVKVLVTQSCPAFCNLMDCSPQGSSICESLQAKKKKKKERKKKRTGVGSCSVLQGIFLIQELNPGLLHYKWILYLLEPPGKPLHPYCCSVTQFCLTLCNPIDCSMPGFPVHCHLLELAQTHVHWVSDAIQPHLPLSSSSLPAFNLS